MALDLHLTTYIPRFNDFPLVNIHESRTAAHSPGM